MIRIDPRVSEAYVVVSEQIRRHARAMRVVNDAADSITNAARGRMRFIVEARRTFRGFAIIGGSAVFDSIFRVRTSTTYHELGHLYGFSHTNGTKDIMNTFRRRGTVENRRRPHAVRGTVWGKRDPLPVLNLFSARFEPSERRRNMKVRLLGDRLYPADPLGAWLALVAMAELRTKHSGENLSLVRQRR